ncbi:MAG TPA: heparan-alpha-glucosaminide N-acetyltransferase domain-containing protein [Pyrinomonadaceae bacterium]
MKSISASNIYSTTTATTLPPETLTDNPLGNAGVDIKAHAPTAATRRLDSVDLLRGLVMVIMMLDHTRDFFHADALRFDPTDLTRTNALLFLTRWVTHFCAPVFVFLAGTGAFLQFMRGKSKAELSRFLLTRGLWLVLLEFTLVRAGITFNFDYHFIGMAQVIWAIGISMIVLAGLIHLPLRVIAGFGIGMVALHNLLDGFRVNAWQGPGTPAPGFKQAVWMVFHQPGIIFFSENVAAMVLYPLIPWIGVMAAGYAFGAVYRMEAERRRRLLLWLGIGLTLTFILIRAINLYGDPQPWRVQQNALFTVLSFLNVTKYPPSLLFLLMTLGPSLMALAWFERLGRGPLSRALITFGRVPLFFYLGQWFVAHGLAVLVSYLAGQSVGWLFASPFTWPFGNPGNVGFRLWVVYLFWILGVLLLYPLCRWYAGVKQRRRDWWLSYL